MIQEIGKHLHLNRDFGLLALRLSVAWVFIPTGYKKLMDLESTGASFGNLGLPMVGFFAVLVGLTEFLGGLAVLTGVFTRFASFALAITMIVASILLLGSGAEYTKLNLGFAMLGSVLVLMAFGPGRHTLQNLLKNSDIQ